MINGTYRTPTAPTPPTAGENVPTTELSPPAEKRGEKNDLVKDFEAYLNGTKLTYVPKTSDDPKPVVQQPI